MKKGLALLLAASMSLSAFSTAFAATELTAQEKFDALKAKGIFEGYTDGSAGLDKEMTRAEFATVLKRLMGLEDGAPVAPTFKDVAAGAWYYGAIEAAVAAGYINGMGNGTYAPSQNVTIEQLAKILVEALDLDVDANATVEGNVSPWAVGYVAAAVKAGLIPAQSDYKAAAKREALVSATYVAAEKVGEEQAAAEYSVKPVGVKKIEVAFGAAVDTSKVQISVKKGNSTVNVSKVEFNEAKTVATVELSAKLTKGEYTVSAKNAAETELSAKFTTEDEKVVAIKIASDKASLDRSRDKEGLAYASLEIQNQYAEDATKTFVGEMTFSSSADKVEVNGDGQIKFFKDENDATEEFNLGEQVVFTAVHPKTGTYAQQTFTISQAAKVAEIKVVKLKHNDDKTLKVDSTASEFRLVVEAKDQYGNDVDAGMLEDDVDVFVSNDNLFDVKTISKTVNGKSVTVADFEKVDDELTLALANGEDGVLKAGKATVYMTSTANGARAQFDVEVVDVSKVDTFSMSTPDKAVAGKDVEIPFEAVDQFGEAITDADVLDNSDAFTSLKVSGANLADSALEFKQDYVNKKAKLVLKTTGHDVDDTAKTVYITVVTSTGKLAQLSFSLQPAAEADVATGIDDFENTLAVQGTAKAAFKFKAEDVNVLDQYGDEFKIQDNLGTAVGKYQIQISKESDESDISLSLNGAAPANSVVIDDSNDEVTLNAVNKGDATFKITVLKVGATKVEEVEDSAKEMTVSVVERSSITGYDVEDLGKLFATDRTGFDKEVKVKGLLSNGTKVVVPVDEQFFTVTGDTYYNSGKITLGEDYFSDADKEQEITIFVLAQTKDGLKQIDKKVVVSNKDRSAEKFELRDGTNVTKESDSVVSVKADIINDLDTNADFISVIANVAVKVEDQYGKEIENSTKYDYKEETAAKAKFKNVVVTGFPSDRDTFAELKAGDELNVTLVAQNNKVFAFKVVVTK